MVSVEDELKTYYDKFPKKEVWSAHRLCGTCAYNIEHLHLTIGEMCEGCRYELLIDPQGRHWVAVKHVDMMFDLWRHGTKEACRAARKGHVFM